MQSNVSCELKVIQLLYFKFNAKAHVKTNVYLY